MFYGNVTYLFICLFGFIFLVARPVWKCWARARQAVPRVICNTNRHLIQLIQFQQFFTCENPNPRWPSADIPVTLTCRSAPRKPHYRDWARTLDHSSDLVNKRWNGPRLCYILIYSSSFYIYSQNIAPKTTKDREPRTGRCYRESTDDRDTIFGHPHSHRHQRDERLNQNA